MINFRFHIVSLTAVLLALGLGLVLGTTFLDTATVDVLRGQLTDLEADLGRARERNEQQQDQLDSYAEESEGLDQQLGERLFAGQLRDAPVLVVAPRGMDEAQVDQARTSLTQANARLVGTWWLTDRLALDDGDEVSDMGEALQLSTDDVSRLRSNLAGQLGDVLFAATDTSRSTAPADVQGLQATPGAADQPAEPPLVARLAERGFVEYEMPEGGDGDAVELPPEGLRILLLSGPGASVRPSQALMPVLFVLAESGAVPVVAAEPSLEAPTGESGEEEAPESLVVSVREDEDLSQRVSTVDDLERVSGTVATVLALADADPAGPRIGHYGLGDGTRLLPPPPEEGE